MKITNVSAIVLKLPEISSAADGTQDDLIIKVERTFQYKYMKVGHEIYGLFKKNNLHEA